jgi:glutamine synthetase
MSRHSRATSPGSSVNWDGLMQNVVNPAATCGGIVARPGQGRRRHRWWGTRPGSADEFQAARITSGRPQRNYAATVRLYPNVFRRACPAHPGAAVTQAPDVAAICATTPDGAAAPESPRTVARRVAEQVAGLGYTLVCGPELEFFVCQQAADGSWQRYANDPGKVYVVGRKGDPEGLLLHMLRQLRDAGLRVTTANHEFSPGQFEINLGHSELADAADRSFRLKSAVQEIARHRGLLATFMAKPFNDEGGSGFHVHISINDVSGANVFGDPDGPDGLSPTARYAIGGVLRHARALSALLNPTVNSFKRFGPDTLAPWLIDWGLDNRSAMVRIPPERGAGARMEVRLGDATANPYLAMAALGAAIYLGIQDKLEPPAKLEGYGYDPARSQMLPMRLGEALDALESDNELGAVLGEFFVTSFPAYKRNEIEASNGLSPTGSSASTRITCEFCRGAYQERRAAPLLLRGRGQ